MIRRLTVVVLLAACGRQPAPVAHAALDAPAPGSLAFDWSPPCSVRVTDRVGRRSPTVTSYRIDVTQRRDEVELHLSDPVFLEEPGQLKPWTVTFLRTNLPADYLPTIIVATSGKILRLQPPLLSHAPPLSTWETAQLDAIMETYWTLWFGAWIDWPIAPATVEDDGFAHLRKTKHVDELGDQTLEAEVEIATMRPRWVIEESADGDRRELTFDWDHAVGCGRDDQGEGAAAGAIPM